MNARKPSDRGATAVIGRGRLDSRRAEVIFSNLLKPFFIP
jgi:hypothetical protein